MSEQNLLETALNYIAATHKDRLMHIEGMPAVMVPRDCQVDTFPELLDRPLRLQQHIEATDAQSWLGYWNRFADDHSTAFFDQKIGKLLGILDYHETLDDDAPMPRHGEHRVAYAFPQTVEWQRWQSHSGKRMNQTDFALFIEDAIPDIVSPPGADLLEIVTTLQAKTDITFASATRLDNGQVQFVYQEDIKGTAGAKGTLKIPDTLQLGIRLFHGMAAYAIEARFRYRIKDGSVTFWYDLVRPERIVEDAMGQVYDQIKAGMQRGQLIKAIVP